MFKRISPVVVLLLALSFLSIALIAQPVKVVQDTFFLAKKKGLLGQLGKSISTDAPILTAVKVANPFLKFNGKIIRHIDLLRLGFERNIYDTTVIKNNFGAILGNGLHKTSTTKTIQNNLFFKSGDPVNPYLLADNERHLRELVFIQDARILMDSIAGTKDSVDLIVITKDIFSLGASLDLQSATKVMVQVDNENLWGSGSRLSIGTLFDKKRYPKWGYDFSFLKRNIRGSFIDWSIGVQNYKAAFNSGRSEETFIYTHFERPLVTPYIPWVGGSDISVHATTNNYLSDSLYKSNFKYHYTNVDLWYGYNFGSKGLIYKNVQSRTRKFIALRSFSQHFIDKPAINFVQYDYRYANSMGLLGAINVFRQEAYRTNFIYGFGRNEDVPEGFSASLIGGWSQMQDRTRPYYGVEALRSHFNKRGFYTTYTVKFGGFLYQKQWEDVDILFNLDHFTRLNVLGSKWRNRNFYSVNYTRQIRPALNQPIFINSVFGLPYFGSTALQGERRITAKGESVFFNMHKYWGFRMAPFLFADIAVFTPVGLPFAKSDVYSGFGAGLRTRNENLTFGTIELKGFYFPKTLPGMKHYRIEMGTNIRFKYNSTFLRKPDFISPN